MEDKQNIAYPIGLIGSSITHNVLLDRFAYVLILQKLYITNCRQTILCHYGMLTEKAHIHTVHSTYLRLTAPLINIDYISSKYILHFFHIRKKKSNFATYKLAAVDRSFMALFYSNYDLHEYPGQLNNM